METNSPGQEATSFAATKIRALCLGHAKVTSKLRSSSSSLEREGRSL